MGSNTHHNYQNYNFNALPAGVRFLPSSRDVTVAATAANPGALPDNFLRPIAGFGNITISGPGHHRAVRLAPDLRPTGASRTASSSPAPIPGRAAPPTAGSRTIRCLPWSARQRNTLVQKEAAVFTYTWDIPAAQLLKPGKVTKQVLRRLAAPGRQAIR